MDFIVNWFYNRLYDFMDWWSIFRGYMAKDHTPLKCTCGCKDLETKNECWQDLNVLLLEYDCCCKKCGKILNHWAYGQWNR